MLRIGPWTLYIHVGLHHNLIIYLSVYLPLYVDIFKDDPISSPKVDFPAVQFQRTFVK